MQYTDNHTLYVLSKYGTNDQLVQCVKKGLENVSKVLGRNIECKLIPNMMTNRDGSLVGAGFLHVSNEEAYNLIIGKNADGSDRVEYRDDPNWKPPVKSKEEAEQELSNKKITSWADLADEEDYIEKQYTCPKIKHVLPSLFELPMFELTPDQKLQYPNGNEGKFTLLPARVNDLDDNLSPNVLCARNVPSWVSKEKLKKLFLPFVSDSKTVVTHKVKGSYVKDTYPLVVINRENTVFVTFDPKTRDAQFALHIRKKVSIQHPDNKDLVWDLKFSHPFKSNRSRQRYNDE